MFWENHSFAISSMHLKLRREPKEIGGSDGVGGSDYKIVNEITGSLEAGGTFREGFSFRVSDVCEPGHSGAAVPGRLRAPPRRREGGGGDGERRLRR